MNTPKNSLPDPEKIFNDLLSKGEINPIDYGIINDGLCSTPEAQEAFDSNQKNKAPIIEDV